VGIIFLAQILVEECLSNREFNSDLLLFIHGTFFLSQRYSRACGSSRSCAGTSWVASIQKALSSASKHKTVYSCDNSITVRSASDNSLRKTYYH